LDGCDEAQEVWLRGGLPPQGVPSVRVYLEEPSGHTTQLLVVGGLDVIEADGEHPDGAWVRVLHAFGPADMPAAIAA